jgi:hypothetical protein
MPEKESISASIDRLLRKTINTHHLIRFRYKNHERIAEPHDYGIQNGIVRLFCYQVGGRSTGRLPGWRMINVSEIRGCEILENQFAGNRNAPTGPHHHWSEVFLRVGAPRDGSK